jgi:hypothetical protein
MGKAGNTCLGVKVTSHAMRKSIFSQRRKGAENSKKKGKEQGSKASLSDLGVATPLRLERVLTSGREDSVLSFAGVRVLLQTAKNPSFRWSLSPTLRDYS